jgi:hypothetical protein
LFAAIREQLQVPLTGLVPVIHAFTAGDRATFEDVGGRTKSGHGEPKVAQESYAPSYSCGKVLNRTAVDLDRCGSLIDKIVIIWYGAWSFDQF